MTLTRTTNYLTKIEKFKEHLDAVVRDKPNQFIVDFASIFLLLLKDLQVCEPKLDSEQLRSRYRALNDLIKRFDNLYEKLHKNVGLDTAVASLLKSEIRGVKLKMSRLLVVPDSPAFVQVAQGYRDCQRSIYFLVAWHNLVVQQKSWTEIVKGFWPKDLERFKKLPTPPQWSRFLKNFPKIHEERVKVLDRFYSAWLFFIIKRSIVKQTALELNYYRSGWAMFFIINPGYCKYLEEASGDYSRACLYIRDIDCKSPIVTDKPLGDINSLKVVKLWDPRRGGSEYEFVYNEYVKRKKLPASFLEDSASWSVYCVRNQLLIEQKALETQTEKTALISNTQPLESVSEFLLSEKASFKTVDVLVNRPIVKTNGKKH